MNVHNHTCFFSSWHLYQVLQSLQYTHLSQEHAGMLHSGFAAQLEGLGLWHWAAFVLLHIQEPTRYVCFSWQIVFNTVVLIAEIHSYIFKSW